MFNKEDKIAVALSGGKDSISLLYVLHKLGYNVIGFHIDLGIENFSTKTKEKILEFHEKTQIPIKIYSLKKLIGASLPKALEYTKRPPCSFCGAVKRYYFNKLSKDIGCNIIATGHNLDDEVSTLLHNILTWNIKYLGRKYPVLKERNNFLRKVKPLFHVRNIEVLYYTQAYELPFISTECPYSTKSKLDFFGNIMNNIEKNFPSTKLNFYNGYLEHFDYFSQYFTNHTKLPDLQNCQICGEPTVSNICMICTLKEKIKGA